MKRSEKSYNERAKIIRDHDLAGMGSFHNYIGEHESLKAHAPSEVCGIEVEGK